MTGEDAPDLLSAMTAGGVDPQVVFEVWQAFPRTDPGALGGAPYSLVVGLLRGRQQLSLRDPAWWPEGGDGMTGVLTLGNLRCVGTHRLYAAVALTAHVLGADCPAPLAALASRLIVEGRAHPPVGAPYGQYADAMTRDEVAAGFGRGRP